FVTAARIRSATVSRQTWLVKPALPRAGRRRGRADDESPEDRTAFAGERRGTPPRDHARAPPRPGVAGFVRGPSRTGSTKTDPIRLAVEPMVRTRPSEKIP